MGKLEGRTVSLSRDQDRFYWRIWSDLRKRDASVDRKALHVQLALPPSHTDWEDEHFDEWKRHWLAVIKPANYRDQVGQLKMPATRALVFIRQLLAAMGEEDSYAETVLRTMNSRGKLGRFAGLETLSAADLGKVRNALKIECRRRWPRKAVLLDAINDLWALHQFPLERAMRAIVAELNWPAGVVLDLERLVYEDLLKALGGLRKLAADVPRFGVAQHKRWSAITDD